MKCYSCMDYVFLSIQARHDAIEAALATMSDDERKLLLSDPDLLFKDKSSGVCSRCKGEGFGSLGGHTFYNGKCGSCGGTGVCPECHGTGIKPERPLYRGV